MAINPLVNLLQDRLRLRRAPSILIVYILVAGLLTGAALLFVPPLIEAAQELTDEVPRYAEQLEQSDLVQRLDEEYDLLNRLEEETTSALEGVAGPDTAFDLARAGGERPGGAHQHRGHLLPAEPLRPPRALLGHRPRPRTDDARTSSASPTASTG